MMPYLSRAIRSPLHKVIFRACIAASLLTAACDPPPAPEPVGAAVVDAPQRQAAVLLPLRRDDFATVKDVRPQEHEQVFELVALRFRLGAQEMCRRWSPLIVSLNIAQTS
jgi:hypothetical protein